MSITLRATAALALLFLVLPPESAQARQRRDTIRSGTAISAEELHRQRREWLERQRLGQIGWEAPAFGSAVVGAPRAGLATGIATGMPVTPYGFGTGALQCNALVLGAGGAWPGGWLPGLSPFGALTFQGLCVPSSPWRGGWPGRGRPGRAEPGLSRSFGSSTLPYPAYPPVGRFYDRFHPDEGRGAFGEYGSPLPFGGYGSPLPFGGYGSPQPFGGYGSPLPFGGYGSPPPFGGYGSPLPFGGYGSPQPFGGSGSPLPFGGIQEYGWGAYGPWRSYPGPLGWSDGAYGWSFSPGGVEAGPTECVDVTVRTAPGREHRIVVGLQSLGLADARDLDLAIDARLSRGDPVVLYGLDGRMLRIEPGTPIDDIVVRPCER